MASYGNPFKQNLSKGVAQMKFMKRLSQGSKEVESTDSVLTEGWVVQGAPEASREERWPPVEHSYVEFEELNTLGRFSFKKYNKETEHLMAAYARHREGSGGSDVEMEEEEKVEDEEGTITAREMARRYKALSDRPKLLGKRKRSSPPYTQ